MRYEKSTAPDNERIVIMKILGEIVFTKGLEELNLDVLRELREKDYRMIIFCFKDVPYINSMGVASFLKLLRNLQERKVKIVFSELQESVKTVFANLGLTQILPHFDTLDAALESLEEDPES